MGLIRQEVISILQCKAAKTRSSDLWSMPWSIIELLQASAECTNATTVTELTALNVVWSSLFASSSVSLQADGAPIAAAWHPPAALAAPRSRAVEQQGLTSTMTTFRDIIVLKDGSVNWAHCCLALCLFH